MSGDVQDRESVLLQLAKLIGLSISTAQAVLPAELHFWYLQQIQVESLSRDPSYQISSNLEFQCKTRTSLVGPKPKTV